MSKHDSLGIEAMRNDIARLTKLVEAKAAKRQSKHLGAK